MRIVVLDGFTLNPGDLSWDGLKALAPCKIYDRSSPSEIIARAAGAEIVLTNKTVLTLEHLRQLPHLRFIGVLATGTNVVDIVAARSRGIVVTNVPDYGTASVAQATLALLLELTNRVGHHAASTRAGKWSVNPDWCYWDVPLVELEGLTMGIVGFGKIGGTVGKLAAALGMRVIAFNPSPRSLPSWVERVDLDTLFRRSDVVSLHCPLTDDTRHLANRERIHLMKPTALLLNTSRGGLVDEKALAEALNAHRIAGAGLDVLNVEPPPSTHPLLTAENCIVTPHHAWATQAARSRLLQTAVANVKAFLSGTPLNRVS